MLWSDVKAVIKVVEPIKPIEPRDVKLEGPFVRRVNAFRESLEKLYQLLLDSKTNERNEVVLDLLDKFPELEHEIETLRKRLLGSWGRSVGHLRKTYLACATAAYCIHGDLERLMKRLENVSPAVRDPIEEQLRIISSPLLIELEDLYAVVHELGEELEESCGEVQS